METPPAACLSLAGRDPLCSLPFLLFLGPGIVLWRVLYSRRSLLMAALWVEAVLVIFVSVRMMSVGGSLLVMDFRVWCARVLLAMPAVFQVRI